MYVYVPSEIISTYRVNINILQFHGIPWNSPEGDILWSHQRMSDFCVIVYSRTSYSFSLKYSQKAVHCSPVRVIRVWGVLCEFMVWSIFGTFLWNMQYCLIFYTYLYIYLIINRVCYKDVPMYSGLSRGCHEIWEALVLRTSNMASTLVQSQMSTCPRWIKLICTIIICSSIGRVSSACHLSDKANIAFRTRGRPFPRPLFRINTWSNITWCHLHNFYDWDRTSIAVCAHNISHSHAWAMGCLLWGFGRNLIEYNGTTPYFIQKYSVDPGPVSI